MQCTKRLSVSSAVDRFSSHSQTVMTFQPKAFKSSVFLWSRSTFRSIFGLQYSWFELGHTNLGQLCLCQKHPLTKMAVRYLGSTISGHPGSFFTFFRYLNPCEKRYFLTISSGFEFVLRIWDIFILRTSLEWLSAIFSLKLIRSSFSCVTVS